MAESWFYLSREDQAEALEDELLGNLGAIFAEIIEQCRALQDRANRKSAG
jgi:hypothetical protein